MEFIKIISKYLGLVEDSKYIWVYILYFKFIYVIMLVIIVLFVKGRLR